LGTPLALALLKQGYSIKGTTTDENKTTFLAGLGIQPYLLQLTEREIKGRIDAFLKEITVLIVNIPPVLRTSSQGSYTKKMQLLLQKVETSEIENVIFVSSTSVYGACDGIITETTTPNPQTESAKQLLEVEHMFQSLNRIGTTVLRFGGLIGPDRHPITHLSGKTGLQNGADTVNLIHLDDCIAMISNIINENYWKIVLNGVYPEHPTKQTYYTKEALKRQIAPPHYLRSEMKKTSKIISTADFYVKKHPFLTSI